VAENIGLRLEPAGSMRRINWSQRRQRALELLARVGANLSPEAEVRTLSMPEQQLVEIACAVGAGARIVVMDEPTASLTSREQDRLFTVVRELRSSGVGIIYISHRLDEIFTLADRVTVLRDGESVGTQPVSAITHAGLIKLMVGREVDQLYPPTEFTGGEIVLELRNVGCAAAGVHNVSLAVRAGEVFGLAGLVGAGRSWRGCCLVSRRPTEVKFYFAENQSPRGRPQRRSLWASLMSRRIAAATASCSSCRLIKI